MAHPFQNILVGQILLSTVARKEMPEGVEFVLLGVLEAALPAQGLEIPPKLFWRDRPVARHKECQFGLPWQGYDNGPQSSRVDWNESVFLVLEFAFTSAPANVSDINSS